MLIIGLTGGIASGKSAVAAELARLGAVVLNADEAAHRVINYPEVKQSLVDRWGSVVLKGNEIDRAAVAARVFGPLSTTTQDREFLEGLLHPRIKVEFQQALENHRITGVPAAVIDAPLLLEANWDEICDLVIFVESPREDRLQRALESRNWTPQEFAAREAAQLPIEEKRRRATHTITNDASLSDLAKRVRDFWVSIGQKIDSA